MRLRLAGKILMLREGLKNAVTDKLGKLERYFYPPKQKFK